MPLTKRDKEKYRQTFNKVIATYSELKSIDGSLSCASLYQSIRNQGSGKAAFNTSIVRATPSDFVCEIERIAQKNLDWDDYRLFYNRYVYNLGDPDWKSEKHRIQEKLGKLFLQLGLHPIEQYFKPRDTR